MRLQRQLLTTRQPVAVAVRMNKGVASDRGRFALSVPRQNPTTGDSVTRQPLQHPAVVSGRPATTHGDDMTTCFAERVAFRHQTPTVSLRSCERRTAHALSHIAYKYNVAPCSFQTNEKPRIKKVGSTEAVFLNILQLFQRDQN
jgi:hypothetical protein